MSAAGPARRAAVTRDDWETPPDLFERLNAEFEFTLDAAAHTNTIEGFWSLVKNGIRGVYHAVGHQHLQTYLNEYVFRYNHREDETPMFLTLLSRIPVLAERPAGVAAGTPNA